MQNLEQKIQEIKSNYSNAIRYFGITNDDLDYYHQVAKRESLKNALEKLASIEGELKKKEKELDQERKMGLHAASGKFGDQSIIDLK